MSGWIKCQKKALEVDAIECTPDNIKELFAIKRDTDSVYTQGVVTKIGWYADYYGVEKFKVTMEMKEGDGSFISKILWEGDYIMKDVLGEYYPCSKEVFKKSYDRI